MGPEQIRVAGIELAEAWLDRRDLAKMPAADLRPATLLDAYGIQDAMARHINEPVSGWKMGATSPAIRRREGHVAPIIGRIFTSTVYRNPAEIPSAKIPNARIEAEFAVRFLTNFQPRQTRYTMRDIADHIEIVPCLEIIGNRYPKHKNSFHLSTFDEIADNGTGIGAVLGKGTSNWSRQQLQDLIIDVTINGGGSAANVVGQDRCVPLEVAVETVNILSHRGLGIDAGQFVSTGGITEPQPIAIGSTFRADFGPFGTLTGRVI